MANGLVQLVVLSGILRIASSSQPCSALLHTPALNSSVTARAGTEFTVDFELCKFNCPEEMFKTFQIVVRKVDKSGTGATYCEIQHENGKCSSNPEEHCSCRNEPYKYQFRDTATRSDKDTKWMLYSENDRIEKKELSVDILYAATVSDVSVTPKNVDSTNTVEDGADIEVVCFWKNGNPPVKARLLDRHGVELTGSKSTEGQIRHTFHPVKCEDAGTIRCEAPGASQNKSVQLLVKCPPMVKSPGKEVRIKEGEETNLKVEVLSYTRDINQCKIRNMNQMSESAHRQCQISSVSGTLPDLTLTVRLDNVRKEEEGQWQLELTNDAGTAHYKFFIEAGRQDEAPVQNDTLSESDDDNSFDIGIFGEHTFIIIVAIGGGVVIVIVISITVAVILVKRGRKDITWSVNEDAFRNVDSVSKWSYSSDSSGARGGAADKTDQISLATFSPGMSRTLSVNGRGGNCIRGAASANDLFRSNSFARIQPRSTKVTEPLEDNMF